MYDVFKDRIAVQLADISGVAVDVLRAAIEPPKQAENGDLALVIPRLRLKGKPNEFAQQWAEKFTPDDYIESVFSTGAFLNFNV